MKDNNIVTFEQRIDHNANVKGLLATKAIELIENKNVIYIDGGTTNLKFAERIPLSYAGRIITNSPSIALLLCNHPNIQINLLAGELDKKSKVIKGSSTLKAVENINIEFCVLGISSIDSTYGITVPSYDEAILKQQLIAQSSEVLGIITKEKIGSVSTFFVDTCESIDYMVTEKELNSTILKTYKDLGIEIITV